jgi:hypothetical protein
MNIAKKDNLYRIATIEKGGKKHLSLHKDADGLFRWYLDNEPTEIAAVTAEEASKMARKQYKEEHFRVLSCGNKFTLPERDEHGTPADYQEMVKSLKSMNGVFFDEKLGHNCIVREIPLEMTRC